jgi:hypothetical protein
MEEAIRSILGRIYSPEKALSLTTNQPNIEFEIRFLDKPMCYERGRLVGHPDIKTTSLSYIEYVIQSKKNSSGLKYRYRKDIDYLYGFEVKKMNLRDLTEKIWTKKISLQREQEGSIQIALASEAQEYVALTDNHYANMRLSFVQCDRYERKDWLIEFKTKYAIRDETKTLSEIISGPLLPETSVEIEYAHDYSKWNPSALDDLFSMVLRQLFFVRDLNMIGLNTKLTNFKTRINIEDHRSLLENQETVSSSFIRYKVDGVTCKFVNHKNICTVYILDRAYSYIMSSNISEELVGEGEYTEEKTPLGLVRRIYPYIVVVDKQELPRLEGLLKYESLPRGSSEADLLFEVVEHIGPFASREERCAELANMIDRIGYQPFKCDGYVFVNSNSLPYDSITDYKFKYDITVDLLAVTQISNSNVVSRRETEKVREHIARIRQTSYSDASTPAINITLFVPNGENVVVYKMISIPANISSLFHFVSRRMNFTSDIEGQTFSHGFKIIVEYSLITNSIVRIRLDKTNRAFISGNYYGNDLSIVNKHEKILDNLWPLELIKEMSRKFEDGYIKTIFKEEDGDDDLLRLNKSKDYFLKDKGRNILGIMTNFIKTQLISVVGSILFEKKRDNVLMIDGGAGGDLNKYYYIGARFVVLTDPRQSNIDEAIKRYNTLAAKNLKNNKGKPFTLHVVRKEIIHPNYYKLITDIIGAKFDIIEMNLSIHYSWGPHKQTLLENIRKLSDKGTRLLITTLDGSKLRPILEREKVYKLTYDFNQDSIFTYVNDEIYSVYLPSVMTEPMEEYYVFPDDLISKMYATGFVKTNIQKSFAEGVYAMKEFFMYGYHKLETQDALKNMFSNMESTMMKMTPNDDLYKLLDLYVGYIFQYSFVSNGK